MAQQKSFERALFDGDIKGPNWQVVDENGERIDPGTQNFGHTRPGRWVSLRELGHHITTVYDFQQPHLAKPELQWRASQYFEIDGIK